MAQPDSAYIQHLTRGGELLRSDQLEAARRELESARAIEPEDARVLNLLGLTYFRLERLDEALEIYDGLVTLQPADGPLRLNLGLVHLKRGSLDDAIRELSRAQELAGARDDARTAGYLGLAYAQKGEYELARDAFVRAKQHELARDMDRHLQQRAPAAAAVGDAEDVSGWEAVAAAQPVEPEPEPEARPVRAATEPDTAPVAAVMAAPVAAEPEPQAEPVRESAASRRLATTPAHPDFDRRAEARARVAARRKTLSIAPRARTENGPSTVTDLVTSRLIRPTDDGPTFEVAAGGALVVRVKGRVLSRTEGVVVSGGELGYRPAMKRVRGRITEVPFGSEERPMFAVEGSGHLVAVPRGAKFTSIELSDDILYLREELVFAFEDHLSWENGGVPGARGSLQVVQFRGEGCVAIRSRQVPIAVKVDAERVLYVDAEVLAGWVGRVVPRVVASGGSEGDQHQATFVECTGEGVVLVDEQAAELDRGVQAEYGGGSPSIPHGEAQP